MSTIVISLIAASLGACLGFIACGLTASGKITDLEKKVFDLENRRP